MSSRPAWSTRASSRTGSKDTEKPCLKKQNKTREREREKEREREREKKDCWRDLPWKAAKSMAVTHPIPPRI